MTAMAKAFEKSGVTRGMIELRTALAKFINQGGTTAQIRAEIDAIERMSGMGHLNCANGQGMPAQTRQPVEDGGAIGLVPDTGPSALAPSSSPNRGEEGRLNAAHSGHPIRSLLVREPKPQRAAIEFGAAAHAIKTRLAQTVLDRVKTSDGRAWGDVGAHELDGMGRDGAMAEALKSHIGVLSNAQRFLTVRELVNAETFEAIRSKVHGA